MKHCDILRTNCLKHFYGRVQSRIGPHVHPKRFADLIIEEMRRGADTPALKFIARLSSRDRVKRVWRASIDGESHFIIYDHTLDAPLTVLLPSWSIKCVRGKRVRDLHLENYQ